MNLETSHDRISTIQFTRSFLSLDLRRRHWSHGSSYTPSPRLMLGYPAVPSRQETPCPLLTPTAPATPEEPASRGGWALRDGATVQGPTQGSAPALRDREHQETPPPKPRSPAQIAASRRNGAKSRGPRNAQSHSGSFGSALHPGILASKIAPTPDGRHEDREYARLLDDLRREFTPRTATEHAWVETLAHDFIELARIKLLQEMSFAPHPMRDGLESDLYPPDVADDLGRINLLLHAVTAGMRLTCSPAEANLLAQLLMNKVGELQDDATSLRTVAEEPGEGTEDPISADPEQEGAANAEWLAWFDQINPAGLFRDESHLQALLSGLDAIPPAHTERWRLLLIQLQQDVQLRLEDAERARRAYDQAWRHHQTHMLDHVGRLQVLESVELQRRKAVERTIALLESRVKERH